MMLKQKVKDQDWDICILQNINPKLEEHIENVNGKSYSAVAAVFKSITRTYSVTTRLLVYDSVVNQVPMGNIPKLIAKYVERTGSQLDRNPHRNTVEMMVLEKGIISDLQMAEELLKHSNSTTGFDATTQEGVHVNSVHYTFKPGCLVVALDQLAGERAEDYSRHICDSVDHLAEVYAKFYDKSFQEC